MWYEKEVEPRPATKKMGWKKERKERGKVRIKKFHNKDNRKGKNRRDQENTKEKSRRR